LFKVHYTKKVSIDGLPYSPSQTKPVNQVKKE
jgi:hypothetical protein